MKSSEELRIARFVERTAGKKELSAEERRSLEAEARRRMVNQVETERNAERCDYVLTNDGSVEQLQLQVTALWPGLRNAAKQRV